MVNEEIRDVLAVQAMMFAEQDEAIRWTPVGKLPDGAAENFAACALFAIVTSEPKAYEDVSGEDFVETLLEAYNLVVDEIRSGNFID